MARRKKTWQQVLVYHPQKAHQGTVKRHYERYRQEHGLPRRCDMPDCSFHTGPLRWKGKTLPVILDHKNGNDRDNRPENLRYLCPNCDSQLPTKGGGNKGKVRDVTEAGFVVLSDGGRKNYHFFASGGSFVSSAAPATFPSEARGGGGGILGGSAPVSVAQAKTESPSTDAAQRRGEQPF